MTPAEEFSGEIKWLLMNPPLPFDGGFDNPMNREYSARLGEYVAGERRAAVLAERDRCSRLAWEIPKRLDYTASRLFYGREVAADIANAIMKAE